MDIPDYPPMMSEGSATPDPLAGCVGKVDRATTHLNSLDRELGVFVNGKPKPWGFVSRVDPQTGKYELRVRIWRPFPIDLSLIVGDFAQNLRAALDHLVSQLVIANGRRPRGNAFPIFGERAEPGSGEERTWNKAVRGLSEDAISFIESCQPYTIEEPHLLAGLRNLSNEDKHRLVLTSHGALASPQEDFSFDVLSMQDAIGIRNGSVHAEAALKDGDVVATAEVEVTGANPKVELKGELPIEIGFGRVPHIVPMRGLEQMMNTVATIIDQAGINWFGGESRWL